MNARWRFGLLIASFGVWLILAGEIIASFWEESLFPLAVLQVLMVSLVYLIGRANVTQAAVSTPAPANTAEKRKRIPTDPDAKMRLLLEMMDKDERYAFKQAMKERMLSGSRDGELNYDADSLGALLDEDEPHPKRKGR